MRRGAHSLTRRPRLASQLELTYEVTYSKSGGGLPVRYLRVYQASGFDAELTWDDLMAVKAAAGLADVEMIEIFPAEVDVMHQGNVRHLWEVPASVREELPGDRGWFAKVSTP